MGGTRDLTETDYPIFRCLEFDDSPAYYYNDNKKINLYVTLNSQIRTYLNSIGYGEHYLTFRNELYYNFYLMNEVLYDNDLYELIDDIIANDLSMPPRLEQQVPERILTGKRKSDESNTHFMN